MPAKGAGMEETTQPASDEPAADATNSRLELQIEESQEAGKAQNSGNVGTNGVATSAAASPTTPASQITSDGKSPMYSCISGAGSQGGEVRTRTDSRGTIIQKGEKKHKVFFIDEVKQGVSVQEVKEVKSFKNNNIRACCTVM